MSSDDRIDRLEARIERLEEQVTALQGALGSVTESPADEASLGTAATEREFDGRDTTESHNAASPSTSPPSTSSHSSGAVSRVVGRLFQRSQAVLRLRSEDWLNYVGIGLLLFGLAFLFRYSIEQGWLVPLVRVGVGVLTGAVLLGAGLRLSEDRGRLRPVLLGGSTATFYGTIFAAYQLYGLVSYPVAFAGMGIVTVGAIALSLREDHASVAVIGTMGGLGTPFLLYAEVSGVAGFALYTCVVLGGACAVYLYRGWRSVLYTAVVGGWGVLLVPCVEAAVSAGRPEGSWVLQGSLLVAWGLFGGTPVLRALLRRWNLGGWTDQYSSFEERVAYGLVCTTPLIALFATRLLWAGTGVSWGGVALGGALLYGGAFVGLRGLSLVHYASAHGLVAAVLLAYGVSAHVGGVPLLSAWAVEALLLLRLGRRVRDAGLRGAGHALFLLVGGWLGVRWATTSPDAVPLLSFDFLLEGVALGLAAGATQGMGRRPRLLYLTGALAGWLAWWRHGLLSLAHGQAYVSLVWGLTAGALLASGVLRDSRRAQEAGLATLGLFVGKLFFVDLAALPALWRIALFLGAGGGFLLLSYALPGIGHVHTRRGDSLE